MKPVIAESKADLHSASGESFTSRRGRRRRGPDRCVSERRIAANRLNARRSTGPRTSAGKAVVRMNALRHGLDAAPGVLLPGEDPGEREALTRAYREDLRPASAEEEALVDRMAEATWLQRRAEAAAYAAAEEAIATHGPGTDVLVMEASAGGRGPFLRAEGWNCRLTGRFARLVRQFIRVRRATRDASRPRGTNPLTRGRRPSGTPGRSAAQRSAGPDPVPLSMLPAETRSGPALAPDRRGAVAPAGIKAIAQPPNPARSSVTEVAKPSGAGRNPRSLATMAGNKAIAKPGLAPAPSAPMSPARNNPIAPPRVARSLAHAVGAVVAGMVDRPLGLSTGMSNGAEQTHCAGRAEALSPYAARPADGRV